MVLEVFAKNVSRVLKVFACFWCVFLFLCFISFFGVFFKVVGCLFGVFFRDELYGM